MNQSSHLSVVNRSILREKEPFKNETPDVFKVLHHNYNNTNTEASTMNESFMTAGELSRTSSLKYSTFDVTKNKFIPEVKKKEFLNPYFFLKPAKLNGNRTSVSNFNKGFKVDRVELTAQRKHYGKHLARTSKEIKFRDSKTAKTRKYAQYLNCTNPVAAPKIHFQKPMKKYNQDGNSNPSAVLQWMNTKTLGDNFMENRNDRSVSEVRKFQDFRNERNIVDVTEGNRRHNKYSKKGGVRGIIENRFGRKASLSVHKSSEDLTGLSKVFVSDSNFYRMNSSRQREGSITLG